jgi:hypothetical protein
MSEITWTAKMFFESADKKVVINDLPVLSFQVSGGMTRTVHLNSAQESELAFELDDARDFKNIQIFIPPAQGIAVTQLGEAFVDKKELEVILAVEAKKGSTRLKAFVLKSDTAVIQRHPITATRENERTLKIEMTLPDPQLQEVSFGRKATIFKPV